MPSYPEDLKYTSEHEWVRKGNENIVRIGITEYATEQLGDIVFVSLPSLGESVSAGDACGEVESTKSVSDFFAPVTGTVTGVNEALSAAPETVNADPYGDGWLIEVEIEDEAELDDLLDADSYAEEVGA